MEVVQHDIDTPTSLPLFVSAKWFEGEIPRYIN